MLVSNPSSTKPTSDLTSGASQSADIASNSTISSIIDGPVMGPVWKDECGSDGDVNMNFCRRVAGANGIEDVNDATGAWPPPPLGALNIASQEHLVASLRPRPSATATGWPWVLAQNSSPNPAVMTIASRWPGWAPCWRHEEFPYLTVTEMADFAAGVRITARHCFMLETLSVHVRPALSVTGIGKPRHGNIQTSKTRMRESDSGAGELERQQEFEFADNMWQQLLNKGYISGDERWLIGEDDEERITIVRF